MNDMFYNQISIILQKKVPMNRKQFYFEMQYNKFFYYK